MSEEYKIVITNTTKNKNGAGSKIGGAGGVKNRQGSQSTQSGSKESGKTNIEKAGDMAYKKLLGLVSYGAAVSTINRIVTHNNSLIEVRTGSKEQQERTSYIYNNVSSFANATLGGVVAGAQFAGVPGAIVGGIIGAVGSAANFGINYLQQSSVIALNKQLETMMRIAATQRVTISGSRYVNATQL